MEQPTDAHWVLKAMVAVAGADGRLNAREVGLIQKVYEDETGRSVDAIGIFREVQAYATRRDVLAELSSVAGSLSAEVKEKIVRAAYLTLLADGCIAGEEFKTLKDIAARWKFLSASFKRSWMKPSEIEGRGNTSAVKSGHRL